MWFQKEIRLKAYSRGFHLISADIISQLPEINQLSIGLLNLLIKHTSASLTLNENADPTVRQDFERFFNMAVPENAAYFKHIDEGSDDMPAHIKNSLLGATLHIPITNGRLNLGIWQGIYLCEHRDHAGSRSIVATIHGE